MRPVIGINLDIEKGPPLKARVNASYYQSVQKAGGIPVLIPPSPERDLVYLLDKLDGLVLIGGDDYSPALYNEEPGLAVKLIDPVRQEFDLCLVKHVLARKSMPLLGICGGLQLLNISLGGSLIQDIPSDLPQSAVCHSKAGSEKGEYARHSVSLDRTSLLGRIYNVDSMLVNSHHHQAVKKLAEGLKAAAQAADGVIEAVELPGRAFAVAVQWHPERDFAGNKVLFECFIEACLEKAGKARDAGGVSR